MRGFGRFLEGFRGIERFSEVFRGFQSFLRGFQRFLRGFQRSSQRPSQRQISSQRLSVPLPLIVLPLELSPIFTAAPTPAPLEGGRGMIVQNRCRCISWEKATTTKMRLSKMPILLCFRPTIRFQDGSPC